ncbi:hypothetical protein [Lysinibacillus sp. Ag94]|uniref:hypothetical protein n=1 Tax=Lysinibacillus sp. Ag94 TaxID=2936682 RepID=UPI002010B449|nr:hypothetical protein [Lysinibacillus sp. Ag94]UPW82340.1 hypothetical protein MY533_16535 [Lysinibacillus sp. Ag94]
MSKVSVKINKEVVEGELVGVFQYSQPIGESIMIGGHAGGVVAYPVAVVKIENELKEVPINRLRYL